MRSPLYDIIQECCYSLQMSLRVAQINSKKPITAGVYFVSELKPSGQWLAEIYVNKGCVFRESYLPSSDKEDLEIGEGLVLNRMLQNIFNNGVMAAKQRIEKAITIE